MSKLYNTFFIDRTSGTHADELLVAGFVRLLHYALTRQMGGTPSIQWENKGAYYQITSDTPLDPQQFESHPLVLAPFIVTPKNKKKLPVIEGNAELVRNYDDEREKNGAFWQTFKSLEKTAKSQVIRGERTDLSPPPDWDILRMINPAALTGYNSLLTQWWQTSGQDLPTLLTLMADLFAKTPNPVEETMGHWKKLAKTQKWKGSADATASQFFNPSQGKGINRAKATGTGLANVKNFWLLEFLKAVGMFEAGFTKTLGSSGDRKIYVPVVGRMTDGMHRTIKKRFEGRMLFGETAVRSDILIILRYLKEFLRYTEEAFQQETDENQWLLDLLEEKRPANFMRGFQMAYYKNMGNAVATMNVAFLNMPRWVLVQNEADVKAYTEILNEHETIVRPLKEDRGEEIDLLQAYRDFITADHLDPFLDFTSLYSHYLISHGEKRYVAQFQEKYLRRLFMSSDPKRFSPILENEGFQNIAYAIRQSTIIAQYRKKKFDDRRYEVRYGLGQELLRQSQYPEDFLKAISDFLIKYNGENAQVMENRSGPYRKSIRMSDIAELTSLIDEYRDAELICKMLVAFGYARTNKETEGEENHETTSS